MCILYLIFYIYIKYYIYLILYLKIDKYCSFKKYNNSNTNISSIDMAQLSPQVRLIVNPYHFFNPHFLYNIWAYLKYILVKKKY